MSPILQATPQITSLPDDLLWNCLARISRMYYPTISLVSKTFRSLLTKPGLYETRSCLGRAESCLYVCLEFPPDPNPRWYTLCRKPHKDKEPSGYVLAQVPVLQSPNSLWSSLVSVGSNIYNIGGHINNKSSNSISILDCRTHTWREGPSMKGKRMSSSASVIEGKIYVGGGYENGGLRPHKSIEVFDTKTETWDFVSIPDLGLNWRFLCRSACIDGKFCLMFGEKGLSYEPKKGKWNLVERDGWNRHSEWAIENVLYRCNEGVVRWYDTKLEEWKKVNNLEGLPYMSSNVELADYGGKMVIVWDKSMPSSGYKNKMIWCAVIRLERYIRKDTWPWGDKKTSSEMWGTVEWFDDVLIVPKSYVLEYAIVVTL